MTHSTPDPLRETDVPHMHPMEVMARNFRSKQRAALAAPQPAPDPLRDALERIDQLARLVAHDLQGRVEGGKVAAVLQCADMARTAMDTPKGGGE